MAAKRGIPAVAFSQGGGADMQYDSTGKLAVEWLAKHRAALAKKPKAHADDDRQLQRAELPVGQVARGEDGEDRTRHPTGRSPGSTARPLGPTPTTDIEAFNQGYSPAVTPAAAVG